MQLISTDIRSLVINRYIRVFGTFEKRSKFAIRFYIVPIKIQVGNAHRGLAGSFVGIRERQCLLIRFLILKSMSVKRKLDEPTQRFVLNLLVSVGGHNISTEEVYLSTLVFEILFSPIPESFPPSSRRSRISFVSNFTYFFLHCSPDQKNRNIFYKILPSSFGSVPSVSILG